MALSETDFLKRLASWNRRDQPVTTALEYVVYSWGADAEFFELPSKQVVCIMVMRYRGGISVGLESVKWDEKYWTAFVPYWFTVDGIGDTGYNKLCPAGPMLAHNTIDDVLSGLNTSNAQKRVRYDRPVYHLGDEDSIYGADNWFIPQLTPEIKMCYF